VSLFPDQQAALDRATESHVFILTGAPGTGKTYTIRQIIAAFPGKTIRLAAPTGKAARRMYELTGTPAQTIHKLLEPEKTDDGFAFTRNESNPVNADIIIIDETSMIDVRLAASLLRAVKPNTRVIFVGDSYQLPPVGPGNVLKDMIDAGLPSVELTTIKRQDAGLIVRNCHHVKNGEDIEIENANGSDFFFLGQVSESKIQKTILDLVARRLPERYGFDPLRDIQIISPLREKTILSCKALNTEAQARLNPAPVIEKSAFKSGDKIIQTKNDYKEGIINGDIGYVTDIDMSEKAVSVEFDNPTRIVTLPLYANNLELAYAVTCHKYQGSEAPAIILPIHPAFGSFLMQRNWLYTAISRAQRLCVIVGHRDEVRKIIGRNQQHKRFTNLGRFLKGE